MLGNNNSLPFSTFSGVSNVSQGAVPDKILDDYTGAVGAYGLRLLRKAYSGNCIQVCTDPLTPTTNAEIGFDSYSLGVDLVAIKTFADANGGVAYVSIWYDQSGSGSSTGNLTVNSGARVLANGFGVYFSGEHHLRGGKLAINFEYDTQFDLTGISNADNFRVSAIFGFDQEEDEPNIGTLFGGSGGASWIINDAQTTQTFGLKGSASPDSYFGPDNGTYVHDTQVALSVGTSGDTLEAIWSLPSGGTDTSSEISDWGASETMSIQYVGSQSHNAEFWQELIIWNTDQDTNAAGILTNQNNYFGVY